MKGINAPEFVGYGLSEEMKGINAPEFAGCRPSEGMRGINAPEFAGCEPSEEMKGINAPEFAGCGFEVGPDFYETKKFRKKRVRWSNCRVLRN
ncbi:hypothetical protein ACFTAO_44345 [Paenibacillus rhizoplanae]